MSAIEAPRGEFNQAVREFCQACSAPSLNTAGRSGSSPRGTTTATRQLDFHPGGMRGRSRNTEDTNGGLFEATN
jgi:hypothetical protein